MSDLPNYGAAVGTEDAELLKAGDWLLHRDKPCRFTRRGPALLEFEKADGWGNDYPHAFIFLGRPDALGWISWTDGENPLPGLLVDVVTDQDVYFQGEPSNSLDWHRHGRGGDIIGWRPAKSEKRDAFTFASDPSAQATLFLEMVNYLRAEEGDAITLNCDNPDFNDLPNCVVDCCGGWTDWEPARFGGNDLDAAVRAAFEAKKEAERKAEAEAAGLEPDATGFVLAPAERIAVAKSLIRLYPHKAEAVLTALLMLPRHEPESAT